MLGLLIVLAVGGVIYTFFDRSVGLGPSAKSNYGQIGNKFVRAEVPMLIDIPSIAFISSETPRIPGGEKYNEVWLTSSFGEYNSKIVMKSEDYQKMLRNGRGMNIDLNDYVFSAMVLREGALGEVSGSLKEALDNSYRTVCGDTAIKLYVGQSDELVVGVGFNLPEEDLKIFGSYPAIEIDIYDECPWFTAYCVATQRCTNRVISSPDGAPDFYQGLCKYLEIDWNPFDVCTCDAVY
jgi:hypothetical protein